MHVLFAVSRRPLSLRTSRIIAVMLFYYCCISPVHTLPSVRVMPLASSTYPVPAPAPDLPDLPFLPMLVRVRLRLVPPFIFVPRNLRGRRASRRRLPRELGNGRAKLRLGIGYAARRALGRGHLARGDGTILARGGARREVRGDAACMGVRRGVRVGVPRRRLLVREARRTSCSWGCGGVYERVEGAELVEGAWQRARGVMRKQGVTRKQRVTRKRRGRGGCAGADGGRLPSARKYGRGRV
ncbi:hypothetical protein B0H17DRAFT_1278782 [Mycena rosella]|uniref:Uncharacterized protein n=1 Tax=Mycena rosella TaxID=1033263 RepID=A0AAD7C2W0_MYCRO|nr:hypothetical protein B0H17DRAFT_1278782 [Mycena rosella]